MGIVLPGRKTFHTRYVARRMCSAGILPALRKMPRPSEQKESEQATGRREDREETGRARFWEAPDFNLSNVNPAGEFPNQSRSDDED